MKRSPIHTDRNPKKKKKLGPRWKTLKGRKRFKNRVEDVLMHRLVDTEEQWLKNRYTRNSKPPVICGKCGATCATASIICIMNNGQNIGCACRHVRVSERRGSRQKRHACNGQCGVVGCTKVFAYASKLKRHLANEVFHCPMCDMKSTHKTCVHRHFRSVHSDMVADDGSCVEHGIPPSGSSPIFLPTSYRDRVDAQTYLMLTKKWGYGWLVHRVRSHIENDRDNTKFSDEERAYTNFLYKNNPACHAIAQEILDLLIERRMFDDGAIDDAGGRLPHGFVMQEHGGVFNLSLDRKNDDLPHFLKDKPVTANINLVALGMNTRSSIVGKFGDKTCEVLRAKIAELHSGDAVERILNRAQVSKRIIPENALYGTCKGVIDAETRRYNQYLTKKRKCSPESIASMEQIRHDFPTLEDIFQHVLQMFVTQNARCAISGILMDNALDAPKWFKPSLDAIEPRKHHVKGNLRIICRFLNSTNSDKKKTHENDTDPESMWTRESFLNYIGVV